MDDVAVLDAPPKGRRSRAKECARPPMSGRTQSNQQKRQTVEVVAMVDAPKRGRGRAKGCVRSRLSGRKHSDPQKGRPKKPKKKQLKRKKISTSTKLLDAQEKNAEHDHAPDIEEDTVPEDASSQMVVRSAQSSIVATAPNVSLEALERMKAILIEQRAEAVEASSSKVGSWAAHPALAFHAAIICQSDRSLKKHYARDPVSTIESLLEDRWKAGHGGNQPLQGTTWCELAEDLRKLDAATERKDLSQSNKIEDLEHAVTLLYNKVVSMPGVVKKDVASFCNNLMAVLDRKMKGSRSFHTSQTLQDLRSRLRVVICQHP